jgi:hypothetical protein
MSNIPGNEVTATWGTIDGTLNNQLDLKTTLDAIAGGTGGTPGPVGPQGPQGVPGDTGPKGDTGSQGIQGVPGVKGDTGLQGIPGAKGDTGLKGDQGIQGIQGIQGPPGVYTPVYAALAAGTTAMAFGINTTVKVIPNATATYTTTVPVAGTMCTLIILTSGTTSRTITFGAGFKPTGTLATGTVTARVFVIHWISDGISLYESGRTAAMTS